MKNKDKYNFSEFKIVKTEIEYPNVVVTFSNGKKKLRFEGLTHTNIYNNILKWLESDYGN